MDQLRATFIAGPSTGLTAQESFTDRASEFDSFKAGLSALLDAAPLQSGSDVTSARRNVMVYYGIGGVGKTALSRQLERHFLNGSDLGVPTDRRVAIRIDFSNTAAFDIESILLATRLAAGKISRKWPAFDCAFTLHWERTHPGEPLPVAILRSSLAKQYSDRAKIGDQMQDTLISVLGEIGMAWAPSRITTRLATIAHEQLSRSATYRKLLRDCPFFEPIVRAEPGVDTLSYMPSLLSWELGRRSPDAQAALAFFLDTFEATNEGNSRSFERLVQRLTFLMPASLFIVTSRSRLDWAELGQTNELDYVGVSRWPLLHVTNVDLEPRQHLVGNLSYEDCETYLKNALVSSDGSPALADDLRAAIIDGSGGLPLYLDLSITQFLEQKVAGQEISVEQFGGPLSSVVTTIMRNLDREQRNILRGVSLLESFDMHLARAVSGAADATIARFANSALVVNATDSPWPHSLHSQLRRTIQETDKDLRDAWSTHEWTNAVQSVLAQLGDVARAAQSNRDRDKMVACFMQACKLMHRVADIPSWILEAAQFLADIGSWQTLEQAQMTLLDRSSPNAATLGYGLRGIVLRRFGSLEDSIGEFDEALAVQAMDPATRQLIELHRTHSLRNSGKYAEAQRAYERIVTSEGPYKDRARLQLADLLLLRGQFQSALVETNSLPNDPDMLGESLRIRGHAYRFNANSQSAERIYRQTLGLARGIRSAALEGKALTNLAETLCWVEPVKATKYAAEAIEFNERLGNQLETLKAYAALGVASSGSTSVAAIAEAIRLVDVTKYRAGYVFALSARLFQQAMSDQRVEASQTLRQIQDGVDTIGVYKFLCQIGHWWLETESPSLYDDIGWLEGSVITKSRWQAILVNRRSNA